RLPGVLERTGLARSTLYALVKSGKFPASIPMGTPHAVAWVESEVDAWVVATITAARPGALAGASFRIEPMRTR
ncbi:MAG: helix-turn-helix transcriptional regulator, partial [Gemmatimonadales bacterium]